MRVLLGRYITEFLLYREWRSKVRFGYIHTDGDSLFKNVQEKMDCSDFSLSCYMLQLLHVTTRHSFKPLEIFFEAHSSLLAELLTLKNILLFSLHGL